MIVPLNLFFLYKISGYSLHNCFSIKKLFQLHCHFIQYQLVKNQLATRFEYNFKTLRNNIIHMFPMSNLWYIVTDKSHIKFDKKILLIISLFKSDLFNSKYFSIEKKKFYECEQKKLISKFKIWINYSQVFLHIKESFKT